MPDSTRVSDARLQELISLKAQDPMPAEGWMHDVDACLLDLQASRERERELVAALKTLVDRLDWTHEQPLYHAVWESAMIHGIDYSQGPQYVKELDVARTALARAEAKEKQP